jgi:superfamily II DNA or RNA helicase
MLTLTETQQEALKFCEYKNKAILAMEPGCGKTITSLSIAKMKGFKKIYLVTPPKLTSFDDDNAKHFDNYFEITKVSHGAFKSDEKKTNKNKKNYNMNLYSNAESLNDDYFIIIDEAHKFKNIESTRTLALYALLHKNNDLPMLMLTGTLRPNMNCDASTLACMMDYWFYKDKPRYNNDFESFQQRIKSITSVSYYYSPSIQDGMFFKRENRYTEELYQALKNIAFFAKKTNKAKKIINAKMFNYTSMQRSILNQMDGRSSLLIGGYKTKINHQTKSRVRDGHLLLSHIYEDKKREMTFLTDKIRFLKTIKNKSIIFTQFTHTAEYLASLLNAKCHTGAITSKESKCIVTSFKTAKEGLLIATIDSLSTGFDIETCDQIIFYSFSYNYANFIQSFDRIHRITSVKNKNYLFLIYNDERNKLDTALSKMDLHFKWLNN